ncbi:MAG: hypothetical protein WDO74_22265 [Pseudomonadota bacterium]
MPTTAKPAETATIRTPARVSFTLSVRRGADNQLIACRMYGTRATSVEPHLVEGKRVIVSGHLRLPKGDGLARLSVDLCQLVGGTRTIRDHEDDPHEDEGEIER